MMSADNSSVARAANYLSRDFAAFSHCKTKGDAITDLGDDGADFYNSTKKPTSASSVTLKQTSTPSPSYPSANSWPGFGNRYVQGDDIQSGRRVYVFSSKMANDAAVGVRQKKYESIIAWHEANCRPSTSKCEFADECQPAPVSKKKRRSVQDCRNGSPLRSCGTPSLCSPLSTMLPTPSQTSRESSGNPPSNPSETPSGELLNSDDHIDTGDNPLRRMERMTQDSLFEPPSKLCRTSSEIAQPARKEQDRNAKLEKMRTLEQQIMYDKAKIEWDRMMHEHEALRMARGYVPPTMPPCSSHSSVPTAYSCTYANQNGMLMQGPCRRPIYHQQAVAEPASSVSNIPMNTPMMVSLPQTSVHNMPVSQPLRPSLNPSTCGMQYTHNGFMCCPYPPNTYPPQGYPSMGSTVSSCFPSNFASNSGNSLPSQPRDFGMYQQGIRTICPPDKMDCEMWGRQLPPVAGDFDNRFSNQKLQYHSGAAVMDNKMLDAVASTNPMFA